MYKTIRFVDDGIDRILNIAFIILFLIGSYFMYDSAYVFQHSKAGNVSGYRPEKGEAVILKDLSEDCVAWITFEGTGLDFPIMQGKDNSEYLNKDPYGDYSLSGSIFLDSRCPDDFSADYSLIYGHHMDGGFMFGCLDSWADKSYFDKHLDGTLTLSDGTEYAVRVFSYLRCDASDDQIFDVQMYSKSQRITWINSHTIHSSDMQDGNIIVFSTCASPMSTERIILAATFK